MDNCRLWLEVCPSDFIPYPNDFMSDSITSMVMSGELEKRTSPVAKFTSTSSRPLFLSFLVTPNAQLEQVIPSTRSRFFSDFSINQNYLIIL